MRDPLNTKRTQRQRLVDMVKGNVVRDAPFVAAVNAHIAASAITAVDAATFGYLNDAQGTACGSIVNGSKNLACPEGLFTAADVGKEIHIQGAGVGGATLVARIAFYSLPTAVVLDTAASTTVAESSTTASGAMVWGLTIDASIDGTPRVAGDGSVSQSLSSAVKSGTVFRSLAERFAEIINVKDFGAKGDGVTDDTAAIQAAINLAVGVGRRVSMSAGTYLTSATLVWPADWPVALVGEGVETTIINYTGNGDAVDIFDAGADTKFIKSSIECLRISGNGATSVNGISIRQGYAIALRNVRIHNFEVGVRVEQSWSVVFDFVRIDSCSQNGLELHNEANNVACYCCEFLDNANGVYVAGARAVLFSGCTLEANTAYGAYITATAGDSQAENITFHGCYIEGNATGEIRVILDSGAVSPQSVVIRDCYFACILGKASVGVRVDQADHVVVEGNDFSSGSDTYAYSLYISDGGTVSRVTFGKNRDASVNGVYRGAGTAYANQDKLMARSWGRFTVSGGAISTINGFNVSSITYVSTGVYEVTLLEPMGGTDYCVAASAENGATYNAMLCSPAQPVSSTVFRIATASNASTAAEARTVIFVVYS